MTNLPEEMRERISDILYEAQSWVDDDELKRKARVVAVTDGTDNSWYNIIDAIMALLEDVRKQTEKAYGGCHNCYGKGYATVNDRWIGHDTDQDIGSPGGYFSGGNASAVKLCACERGKDLEKRFRDVDRRALEKEVIM